MDLMSQSDLASLNECLYTHFVDLFTQPNQPERKSTIDTPDGRIYQHVVPSYGVARALETSLSEALNTKCLLLPTGSSAGGVVVPAYEYSQEGHICRYDSDVDYMFCIDFSDLFRWCHNNAEGVKKQDDLGKVVPLLENSKEHPGFCLVKLHPDLTEYLSTHFDVSITRHGSLIHNERKLSLMLCVSVILFLVIPFCQVLHHHCLVFVLLTFLTFLLFVNCEKDNETALLWGTLANFFKTKVIKPEPGHGAGEVVLGPQDFMAFVYFILNLVRYSTKYQIKSFDGNLEIDLELDSFVSFIITGPSIQTIIDLTKFKESDILDVAYVSYSPRVVENDDEASPACHDNSEVAESQNTANDSKSADRSIITSEDMDLVPALSLGGWPVAAAAWLARKRQWPDENLVREIHQGGFHLVTVQPKSGWDTRDLWRISFSKAELSLLRALSDKSWCKHTYRIFKWLVKGGIKNPKGVLPSYFLLTIFFWTLESHHPDSWNNKSLATYTLLLLDKLIFCLAHQHLPNYFIPESNLMKHMDPQSRQTVLKRVSTLRRDPMRFCVRPNSIPWDPELTGITIEDMLAWSDGNN